MKKGLQRSRSGDGDAIVRCWWCGGHPEYVAYHDREWGFPVADDTRLFEKLCLEGFQAGLSWLTILRKREAFRQAFRCFDIEAVARMGRRDVNRLLRNEGIVRHRGKIESTLNNARRTMEIFDEHGSFAAWLWRFEPSSTERPRRLDFRTLSVMTQSPESVALSRALKKRGFSFVGPTTMYALMQSVGLVNDHLEGCAIRVDVAEARRVFRPPPPDGATA